MIDINNKKYNFYDPVEIIEQEKKPESFFSDIIYILSEKYIPKREKNKIRNQFSNLVQNYSKPKSENSTFQKIFSGFENLLNENLILRLEENINKVSLLKSNFILIDLNNNNNFKFTETLINKILNKRMIPIISHPERFEFLNNERIEKLHKNGVLFQLSIGSFSSVFGDKYRIKSIDLLESGIYDFIATDTINYYEVNDEFLEIQINKIIKIIGSNKLNELIYKNPRYIIDEKSSNDYELLHIK